MAQDPALLPGCHTSRAGWTMHASEVRPRVEADAEGSAQDEGGGWAVGGRSAGRGGGAVVEVAKVEGGTSSSADPSFELRGIDGAENAVGAARISGETVLHVAGDGDHDRLIEIGAVGDFGQRLRQDVQQQVDGCDSLQGAGAQRGQQLEIMEVVVAERGETALHGGLAEVEDEGAA